MNIRKSASVAILMAATGLFAVPVTHAAPAAAAGGKAAAPAGGDAGRTGSVTGAGSGGGAPNAGAPSVGSAAPNEGRSTQSNVTANANANKNSAATSARQNAIRTRIINSPQLYNGTPIVAIPTYGDVPYNGFNFGYGDYSGYGYGNSSIDQTAQSIADSHANGGTTTAQPASPSTSTSNPAAEAARNEMITIQSRELKEYTNTEEYKSALADVRKAADEYRTVSQKADHAVAAEPAVKEAVAQKQEAQKEIDAQQAAHQIPATTAPSAAVAATPYSTQVVQAAQKKLNAETKVKQAQGEEKSKDPAVVEAKEKLDKAVAHFEELRNSYETKVIADKDWQAAKQRLDTAMASSGTGK